jgi:hypothetical protein
MKRVPEQDAQHLPAMAHADAAKPLSAFRRIVVTCNDCGDVSVLDEDRLAELSAVPTFGDLWRLAFCPACRDSGAPGPANVDLHGDTMKAPEAGSQPECSRKRVFDQDRSDPHPNLPRRPMFRR